MSILRQVSRCFFGFDRFVKHLFRTKTSSNKTLCKKFESAKWLVLQSGPVLPVINVGL